jgi:23S rRNA pseudouridine1911/1915/1917 synthase
MSTPDSDDVIDGDDDASASPAVAESGAPDLVIPATGLTVEPRAHGWRVDQYLVRLYPNFSRALFQKAIADGGVTVNGLPVKMSRRLRVNDRVDVRLPERADESLAAEDIPLEVLFEDAHLVVINKAAGLITHPGKGNYGGTLANALQFHFDSLSDVAGRCRPGIVHRLDRDTSGVIVVAKNNQVHGQLSAQFERRETRKEYRAIAWGRVANDSGVIETHMRVHPGNREKMTVCEPGGNSREATTGYEVLERFAEFTYVRMLPKTGRTHQIRVHLRHLGHPIIADGLYGGRECLTASFIDRGEPGGCTGAAAAKLPKRDDGLPDDTLISRQALHAFRLEFRHPATGRDVAFEAPLPVDMERTLERLRAAATRPVERETWKFHRERKPGT